MIAAAIHCNAANYLRVNQIGYLVDDVKVAVIMMEHGDAPTSFCVVNADSGKKTVMHSVKPTGEFAGFAQTARLDFSKVKTPGTYYITAAGAKSSSFRIANDAYAGAQEVPLNYMRQQRCGWNPLMRDSCHRYDGRLQLCGDRDGEHVDVRGGWHDASDYLQYLTTSANAVYQMLFAYSQNPSVWADNFQTDGTEGANGIPDILDEARWGLEWMLKMQDRPVEEYECNARGIDLRRNFPTNYYQRKRVNQEPASENETRALISIFQEYSSLGLLTFSYSRGKIVYCRQEKGFAYNQKNYRLARHLQKCSGYRLEKGIAGGARVKKAGAKPEMGSPEQFYAEVIRQPSLAIEIPEYRKDDMEELRLIPLEYLYSLNSGILANA